MPFTRREEGRMQVIEEVCLSPRRGSRHKLTDSVTPRSSGVLPAGKPVVARKAGIAVPISQTRKLSPNEVNRHLYFLFELLNDCAFIRGQDENTFEN